MRAAAPRVRTTLAPVIIARDYPMSDQVKFVRVKADMVNGCRGGYVYRVEHSTGVSLRIVSLAGAFSATVTWDDVEECEEPAHRTPPVGRYTRSKLWGEVVLGELAQNSNVPQSVSAADAVLAAFDERF